MATVSHVATESFEVLYNNQHPNYHDRYKIFLGGRGGRKSWEIATALILRAYKSKLLFLCTREIQNSIGDSVLSLLSNRIEALGLTDYFDIQKTTIIGKNGSEFKFKGLNGLTIDSIKSFEGVDVCWVEEAHSVSQRSWEVLIPTIRKQGSEIWASFNPDLPTDPVYARFVLTPPANAYVKKVSYLNNPDCPQTLIDEADYLRKIDYEAYSHVYLGEVRQHSEAQVFKGKYRVESFEVDNTFGYPLQGCDWGFDPDPTVIIRSYIKEKKLYIRYESYKVACEIENLPALFGVIPDVKKWVIQPDSSRPELINYLARAGFAINRNAGQLKWAGCVEDRIDFMRNFEAIIIHPECKHTAEEFRLYSRKVDKRTSEILPILEDKHNHCIDAIGYALTPIIKRPVSAPKFKVPKYH
jgi:phage terminase large subunit